MKSQKSGTRKMKKLDAMKAFAREIGLIAESVFFWMAALPLAFLAWPVLVLSEKARNVGLFDNLRSSKSVASRVTYDFVRL
jgi:hypothetical protein